MIDMISNAAHYIESIGIPYGAAAITIVGFGSLAALLVVTKIIEAIALLSER